MATVLLEIDDARLSTGFGAIVHVVAKRTEDTLVSLSFRIEDA